MKPSSRKYSRHPEMPLYLPTVYPTPSEHTTIVAILAIVVQSIIHPLEPKGTAKRLDIENLLYLAMLYYLPMCLTSSFEITW